jgi:hypothetical protein
MLAPDLLERVAAVDVAALCDANKDIRVMDPGLRPITAFRQMMEAEAPGRWQASCLPLRRPAASWPAS